MPNLFLPATIPAKDAEGNPLPNATWHFFLKETYTPAEVLGGDTSVGSSFDGSFDDVTLEADVTYRAALKDKDGKTLLDIGAVLDNFFSVGVKGAVNEDGSPATGATWSFFKVSDGSRASVYSDSTLQTPLGYSVKANAAGRFPLIYLDETVTYKAEYSVNGTVINEINPVSVNTMLLFLDPTRNLPIEPGASWNGTAGTGFTSVPTDPTRTTAKPACRLMVAPNQYFTNELTIGVFAAANNNDSLYDNLGLEKVQVYFENDTPTDILRPRVHTFNDVNGVTRSYFGWWVTLKKPASVSGHANVYFKAIPKDVTMQSRVIGPYQFSPQVSQYTHEIEVNSTLSVVAGSRYQTLTAAFDYLRTQAAQNPRITITGGTRYAMPIPSLTYTVLNGYVHVRATTPVTLGATTTYDGTSNTNQMRPRVTALHFVGNNLTFNFDEYPNYYSETGARLWLDGINVTNTRAGTPILYRNTFGIFYSSLWRESPWITECSFTGKGYTLFSAACNLVRGNTYTGTNADLFNDSLCVVGNVATNLSSTEYTTDRAAITIRYSGAGSTATVEQSGGAGDDNRNITFKVAGTTVGTFTADTSNDAVTGYAASLANSPNARYTVQDLADYVNTLSGWTATVTSDAIAAHWLGKAGGAAGSFAATDAKTADLILYSNISVHADLYQMGSAQENVVFANNVASGCIAQMLFLAPDVGTSGMDIVVIGNVFGTDASDTHSSQWGKKPFYHTVIAHNTWDHQDMLLRPSQSLNCDAYCLFANNVLPALSWTGTPDADLAIKDNHLFAGGVNPTYGVGTTIGGTVSTLFGAGFTPTGELLTNLKTATVGRDTNNAVRPSLDAAGAVTSA